MTARNLVDVPDFTDSRQLRLILNQYRKTLHAAAMHMHITASELEAALMTIPAVDTNRMLSRSVQRRRARRVSRHLKHGAECMVATSASCVRTWAEFRRVYAAELAPATTRGKRSAFKVVPE